MVQERIAVEFWLTVGRVRIRELKMQLPIKAGVFGALLAALSGMSLPPAFGQIQTANPARENLEEQFVDPLTTLPQVFLKDDFSPVNYGNARVPCWIVRVPKEIIWGHGGLWSDNSVAMLAALFRIHFPLTAGGMVAPPQPHLAPRAPDLQQLNQDKLR
jgi:hypothetical protein